MVKTKDTDVVYPVKMTLNRIRPPIWRRVQVEDCTLGKLHDIIQTSMGWYNCHLHEFEIGMERYGDTRQWQDGFGGGADVGDERKMKLSQLIAAGVKKFRYVYDMGDSWEHTIQLEKARAREPGVRYPRCIAGERACPPEDCGGPWTYVGFVDAVQDPANDRHEEFLEWLGGEFDPEKFDIEAVNKKLR
jgi:hypothetical protein